MIEIMKLTSRKEEVIKQYIRSDNLEKELIFINIAHLM